MLDLPVPDPGKKEIRVKVQASTISVDDQHMAEGSMFGGFPVAPHPTSKQPWVPGTDLVGIIDHVGSSVRGLHKGDLVCGMRPPKLPGPWAEYCVTRADFVSNVPHDWSTEESAALPVSGTVICSILSAMGPVEGRCCLVVGASGSLGTMMVPALKSAGARVWAVCSGKNRALVEGLGADRVLDYTEASFGSQLASEGRCVDSTVDLLGGRDTHRQGLAVTRKQGSFVTVVGPEQHVGQRRLSAFQLMGMLGRISWSMLGSRFSGPRYVFAAPLAPDWGAIHQSLVKPNIRPAIDRIVEFGEESVRDAIGYVASHRARGKVVIKL